MKKHTPTKLSLAPSTVRRLSDTQLAQPAGGGGSASGCVVQSGSCYSRGTHTNSTTGG